MSILYQFRISYTGNIDHRCNNGWLKTYRYLPRSRYVNDEDDDDDDYNDSINGKFKKPPFSTRMFICYAGEIKEHR